MSDKIKFKKPFFPLLSSGLDKFENIFRVDVLNCIKFEFCKLFEGFPSGRKKVGEAISRHIVVGVKRNVCIS